MRMIRLIFISALVLFLQAYAFGGTADYLLPATRQILKNHIAAYFAEQLTNPQKKNRKSLSQFGYNLSLLAFPLYPITSFINPDKFGIQSYGKPGIKEYNGSLYTCKAGFMDFSHIRCAADWTVFLTFKIITDNGDFDLPPEAGSLNLHFQQLDKLTLEDIASLAQRIAFERLVWHEVASWHYHPPNFIASEQQSTFTPEDVYSDFLGTVIGRNIALRILKNMDTIAYSQIATEEIEKTISVLEPLTTKKGSAEAYDIVDRNKQLKLPDDKRNKDIWYDSQIPFTDERYMFKRNMSIGPVMTPWLVPHPEQLGCPAKPKADLLYVPQQTTSGTPINAYYTFSIHPDSILFYNKNTGNELHPPFATFTTLHYKTIMRQIKTEMQEKLLAGFDKRNSFDPVPYFKGAHKVLFK